MDEDNQGVEDKMKNGANVSIINFQNKAIQSNIEFKICFWINKK